MKVGVIIPYKEDRGWLKEAKESVRNQTYKNIALIDSQGDCSVGKNINEGIKIAKQAGCELVRYLCEDDMLTEDSVRLTVEYFENNPEIDFCHGNAITYYNQEDRRAHYIAPIEKPTLKQMIELNRLHGGTVTYRIGCFAFNQFDESLWTGEEYDFNMNLMSQGFKIGKIPHPLYIYRRHSQQKSLGNISTEYQLKRQRAIKEIQNRYK